MADIPQLSKADYDLLVTFRNGPQPFPVEQGARAQGLIDRNLIAPYSHKQAAVGLRPDLWGITPRGEDALSAYEKEIEDVRQRSAQETAGHRYDRRTQILTTILGVVLGFLLGEIARDWHPILDLLKRLVDFKG